MTFNIKDYQKDLLFIPLGGAKEIGMNLNLYYFKGKWLIVDFGAGFADENLPGIDLLVPDISFLNDKVKDILGIVITHAHEDHLGAIEYLWQELKCPIYTTAFTAAFIKERISNTDFYKQIKIHQVEEGSKINLGPFAIEMVPITHSTPEMQGLMIRTEAGNIFHTGDWKFDPNPLITSSTDIEKLKTLGDEGVLAVVGDSTNVFNHDHSGSEGELQDSIIKIVAECEKTVLVTTFASNVARLETILKAAKLANRKVAIAGKSLWRIIAAARESGYLKELPDLVSDENIKNIPRENLLIIATGCQGEPLAATTKIALNTHPHIRLTNGDTVIFSSKIIPGNEKKIFRIFNQFVHNGVKTYTEKDHFVHVSGHPSASEMKEMYSYLKPKVVIPVHGELVHMYEHARLAKSWGVPETVLVENGVVVKLSPKTEIVGSVPVGYLAIDGYCLLPANSKIIKMRRKMSEAGIVTITLIMNSKGYQLSAPIVKAPGLLDPSEDNNLIRAIEEEIEEVLSQNRENKNKAHAPSDETIINLTKSAARRVVKHNLGKHPMIDVHIAKI